MNDNEDTLIRVKALDFALRMEPAPAAGVVETAGKFYDFLTARKPIALETTNDPE